MCLPLKGGLCFLSLGFVGVVFKVDGMLFMSFSWFVALVLGTLEGPGTGSILRSCHVMPQASKVPTTPFRRTFRMGVVVSHRFVHWNTRCDEYWGRLAV